jgi:serine/threonine protein kinase
MADHIGQQIDNYRLLRLLGEGGFAQVYLGEHNYLGTQAAIKLLSMRMARNDIAQFQQEARLLANLTHPHIVRILDFGVAEQTPYLIMEYAPGGTLRMRHPKGTRLPVPTIVEYVKQIAEALQYAHEQKLIHRDIKPENMLVGRNGNILLSDFGIALIAQSSRYQSLQDMAGTIAYMAPEQIEAHSRFASDQYALGIAVYEWLSGSRPFDGSFAEIAVKQCATPPPSLCERVPTLSPALEQVVFTALAKKPEERFASVHDFANALEKVCLNASTELLHSQSESIDTSEAISANLAAQLSTILPESSQSIPAVWALPTDPAHKKTKRPVEPVRKETKRPAELVRKEEKRRLSRRALIIGAVGITTAGSVSTGVFWFLTHAFQARGTRLVTYNGHSDGVDAVAWSPDGKRIASGSWDKTVQVWNASDGGQPFTYRGHSDNVNTVAWSPDGKRIASGSTDKTVQVWNASDGSLLFTYRGHSDVVNAVAWSPDGKHIVSGAVDETVQIWNANDAGHSLIYRGHSDVVDAIAWSSDGSRIASGSWDHLVQVWQAV